MTSNYTPPNLVTPTPNGSNGDGSLVGKLTLESTTSGYSGYAAANSDTILAVGSSGKAALNATPGDIGPSFSGNLRVSGELVLDDNISAEQTSSKFITYAGVNVVGLGVPPLYGLDNRTGLTATDSSAKTLYTSTAASQVYRVTARVFGKSGTISSAVYTIGWTEGGTAMTETVSISAVSTLDSAVFLLQPDNGKAITVQLTTLSGTSPVVDVAATLEQMA